MNSNPHRDEKLKTEMLKYVDSFPCGYITYKNLINKFSHIKKDKINFNLVELESSRYITISPGSKSDFVNITNLGKSIINPKDRFLNENKINKGFFISHWQWIIATIIAIVGLFIAYLQLLKTK